MLHQQYTASTNGAANASPNGHMNDESFTILQFANGKSGTRRLFSVGTLPQVDGHSEAFTSLYRYNDSLREHQQRSKNGTSIEGYSGPCAADFAGFDFDGKDDPTLALVHARTLVTRATTLGVSRESIRCYFSGEKGIHVEIPFASPIIGYDTPKIVENICVSLAGDPNGEKGILSTVDAGIYSLTHIWRIPNTRHASSQRYKLPLTVGELFELEIPDMRDMAAQPRHVDYPFGESAEWFDALLDLVALHGTPMPVAILAEGFRSAKLFNDGVSFHRAALYLGGWLAKAKWELDHVLTFVDMVCLLAGDTAEPADRRRAIEDTFRKLEAGADPKTIGGYERLCDEIGVAPVAAAAAKLNLRDDAAVLEARREIDAVLSSGDSSKLNDLIPHLARLSESECEDRVDAIFARFNSRVQGTRGRFMARIKAKRKEYGRIAPITGRPAIFPGGRHVREVGDEVLTILSRGNDPMYLFTRGSQIVRRTTGDDGRAKIAPLNRDGLVHQLFKAIDWYSPGDNGKPTPSGPNDGILSYILGAEAWPFPALDAITETPFLAPDGRIITAAGYEPITRTYYQPASTKPFPSLPGSPNGEDAREAVEWLRWRFGQFPFVSEASWANTLAMLLTPLIRPFIGTYNDWGRWESALAPMFAVDKPEKGTGATLLTDIASIIATGSAALAHRPGDDAELEKRLFSALREGRTFLAFDNADGEWESQYLASFLTAANPQNRPLVTNKIESYPNRLTLIMNGNGIILGPSLVRRVALIQMDAKHHAPDRRRGPGDGDTWNIPDLETYTRRHRIEIIAKLLTLPLAWITAGQPQHPMEAFASFQQWGDTMNSILTFAGVTDFMANRDDIAEEVSEAKDSTSVFLEALHKLLEGKPFTVKELIEKHLPGLSLTAMQSLSTDGLLPEDIEEIWSDPHTPQTMMPRKLGKRFQAMQRKTYPGGWSLRKHKESESMHGAKWIIKKW